MPNENHDNKPLRQAGYRAMAGAIGVFVITTIHHMYGAWLYHTPWRNHAALAAGIPTGVLVTAGLASRRRPNAILRGIFIGVTLLVPILLFGGFEGAYNHVLKNVLYFGGASPATMTKLFPPPKYEMPNDVFFEVSGIMQVVPAAYSAYYLYRFLRARKEKMRE